MANEPTQRIPVIHAVEALTHALRVWDEESFRHCVKTSEYAVAIARELGIAGEEADHIRIGALLHDIGKMGVDLVVLKKPGPFDAVEAERMRLHPGMGASILERVLPQPIVDCAAWHHEQPDGLGYPRGLSESRIPLGALVCRVADVLDSLTTEQPYRPAMTLDEALGELRDGAGSRYSQRAVDALLRLVERDELTSAA